LTGGTEFLSHFLLSDKTCGRFHELFPPLLEPIQTFEDKKARVAKYAKGEG
jgi:hypothetical protein